MVAFILKLQMLAITFHISCRQMPFSVHLGFSVTTNLLQLMDRLRIHSRNLLMIRS